MATPLEMSKNERTVEYTLQKVRDQLKGYPKKSQIKGQIKKGIRGITRPLFNNKKNIPKRGEIIHNYDDLLRNKVDDNTVKEQIIKYAEIVLQPDTLCELGLISRDVEVATLKVFCCLPEHGQVFANFWIGKTIESAEWKIIINQFKNYCAPYNIGMVGEEKIPTGKVTITGIKTGFIHQ